MAGVPEQGAGQPQIRQERGRGMSKKEILGLEQVTGGRVDLLTCIPVLSMCDA